MKSNFESLYNGRKAADYNDGHRIVSSNEICKNGTFTSTVVYQITANNTYQLL